jgi:hypothetical protein
MIFIILNDDNHYDSDADDGDDSDDYDTNDKRRQC